MPDEVLKTTLELTHNGMQFVFAIPSYADEIKIGLKERDIRRSLEMEVLGPNPTEEQQRWVVGVPTMDQVTENMIRAAATFTLLLKQTSEKWLFSQATPDAQPAVDFRKWPTNKVTAVMEVWRLYETELNRFREGGITTQDAAGAQAVGGQPNPSDESV